VIKRFEKRRRNFSPEKLTGLEPEIFHPFNYQENEFVKKNRLHFVGLNMFNSNIVSFHLAVFDPI